jgi:hypothetical protein
MIFGFGWYLGIQFFYLTLYFRLAGNGSNQVGGISTLGQFSGRLLLACL